MGKFKTRNIQGRKGRRFVEELRGVSLDQLLIVPIDAAKHLPKALICNYFGDILEDSFFFAIDSEGLGDLESRIRKCAKACNAVKILIGIEATSHYYEDIVRYLENKGYQVTIINTYTTSEERASALSWTKTDDIDLAAIASAIMRNKGTEFKLPTGNYDKLLTVTRARRSEIKKRSILQVEICQLMDVIWPGFQGKAVINNGKAQVKKIFSDLWSKTSCLLMRHYPLPQQILALGFDGLRLLSKENKLRMRSNVIHSLLNSARLALVKSPADLEIELHQLQTKLDDLERANYKIGVLEQKIEELLVQTPGVLLLSTPQIGVISAAEFTAEAGPIEQYTHAGQIIKKAGTNSLVDQTGGGEPIYGPISKQGNPSFRAVIYSIGYTLSSVKTTNPYFKDFANRLKSKGKKTNQVCIATGNKFIRVAFAILKNKQLFKPPLWDGPPITKDILAKIQDEDNRVVAQETLDNLLKNKASQKVC